MRKIIQAGVFAVFLSQSVFATWARISLDELVAKSDLIVTGSLHSAFENTEGIGHGYIQVDQIISIGTTTIMGHNLKSGDNLKIEWADNWACAEGMHRAREHQDGVWLLTIEENGTVKAAYPGRFRPIEDIPEIQKWLRTKRLKKESRVDVVTISSNALTTANESKPVDVAPYYEFYPMRAILALLVSFGLYILLYRSRFRIR